MLSDFRWWNRPPTPRVAKNANLTDKKADVLISSGANRPEINFLATLPGNPHVDLTVGNFQGKIKTGQKGGCG